MNKELNDTIICKTNDDFHTQHGFSAVKAPDTIFIFC